MLIFYIEWRKSSLLLLMTRNSLRIMSAVGTEPAREKVGD